MEILTYNLWHGLKPSSKFFFSPLEPGLRRTQRREACLRLLREEKFAVAFLQEVNPLWARVKEFQDSLGLAVFAQPDLHGTRVARVGLPVNLESGLVTLVAPALQPRLVKAVQLSGPRLSFATPWLSLQWEEVRFALLVEALHPSLGRILLVNTHLHHGLEWTNALQNQVRDLVHRDVISGGAFAELKDRIGKADDRRLVESEVLLAELAHLRSRYAVTIVGGDFNFTPESEVYQIWRESGFCDLAGASGLPDLFTYDMHTNVASHVFAKDFPLGIDFADLSFSESARQEVESILRQAEATPRRIDHLWLRTAESVSLQVTRASLLGRPSQESTVVPSDHFGLKVQIEG